jgi:hypothetical protein
MASNLGDDSGPPGGQAKGARRGPAAAATGATLAGGERSGRAYVPLPSELSGRRGSRRWLWLFAAILCAGAAGAAVYSLGILTPPGAGRGSPGTTLTVSDLDIDQAATAEAIAAIKSGTQDPLVANLNSEERADVVSGQRKFYRIGVTPGAPGADRAEPAAVAPGPPIEQSAPTAEPTLARTEARPAPAHVRHPRATTSDASSGLQPALVAASPVPAPSAAGDRIQVSFNGHVYGVYVVTNQVFSLDLPLRAGDVVSVTCLSLSGGKTSVTIDMGTTIGPGERQLSLGQTVAFPVVPANHSGRNYQWFVDEANKGNPVAEYGLGHLYEFGLGVAEDKAEALRWYQKAADQDYMDAKQRVAALRQ